MGMFCASTVFAGALEPGKPVKIYILDSGFNPNEAPENVPKDLIFHDTESGGNGLNTLAGDHGTSMVKEYYKRLAPDIQAGRAELHVVKMHTDAGGSFTNDSMVKAMEMAHRDGAHIVNMSFGSAATHLSENDTRLKATLDDMQKAGTVVLHAAGNDGDTFLGKNYVDNFSTHLGVISVGGLDPTKNNKEIIDYSSGALTGRVDVYATTVYDDGGTSTAAAYTGAAIASEFLAGNLNQSFDYDGDGKLRGREVISFLSSPQFSDKQNVIGADEAAYKTLLYAGYSYDQERNQFFVASADGSRTYIVPRDIGIYDQPTVIASRMREYVRDPDLVNEDGAMMDLYYDIGMRPFNWGKSTADPESLNVSEQIFVISLDLSQNGWVYDAQEGVFKKDGFDITINPIHLKDASPEDYCQYMRYVELSNAGYRFEEYVGGNLVIMRNDNEMLRNENDVNKLPYTYKDLADDKIYNDLLAQKNITPSDASFSAENSLICDNGYDQDGVEPSTKNPSTEEASANNPPSSSAGNAGSGNAGGSSNSGGGAGGAAPPAVNGALVNCGKSGQPSCTICDLVAGIHGIIQWLIKMMVIVGLVVITAAGIMYIVSAGGALTSTAVSAVKYTLIGVTVVLVAFVMITFLLNRVFDVDAQILAEGGLKGIGAQAWNFSCTAAPTGTATSR